MLLISFPEDAKIPCENISPPYPLISALKMKISAGGSRLKSEYIDWEKLYDHEDF